MLLSIALDPFYQQLVAYPQRPNQFGFAGPTRSTTFSTEDVSITLANNETEKYQDVLVMNGIWDGLQWNLSRVIHKPICASESCYWPEFETLGVCSQCKEAPELVEYGCLYESGIWSGYRNLTSDITSQQIINDTSSIMSCGYFLNATSENPVLMTGYAVLDNSTTKMTKGEALWLSQLVLNPALSNETYWDGSINFKNIADSWPILDFIVAMNTNISAVYNDVRPQVSECVLTWCIKTITAQSQKGNYTETIISTYSNTSVLPEQAQWLWDNNDEASEPYAKYDIHISSPSTNHSFIVSARTVSQTDFTIASYIPFYVYSENVTAPPIMKYQMDMNAFSDPPLYTPWDMQDWPKPSSISDYMDRLVYSMTNVIRTYPNSSEPVNGYGGVEAYIHIQWAWISLPLMILTSSLIMLTYTIWDGYKLKQRGAVWKTSLLAAMVHGLDDNIRSEFREYYGLSDIRRKASEVEIILQPVDDKYKIERVESNLSR
jgi:hypothetical protein